MPKGVLLFMVVLVLAVPVKSPAKSIEEQNREFDALFSEQNDLFEERVGVQNAEFERRREELTRKFEEVRDKVLKAFGNDPAKAKKKVWRGEKEKKGRREVRLQPALRMETANVGRGKIEVTVVTVPEAVLGTAKKQAVSEAREIAAFKLSEQVKTMVQAQAPEREVGEKAVSEMVDEGVRFSRPVFVEDKTVSPVPLCYVKAEIPIFSAHAAELQGPSVESIIRKQIPMPPPRKGAAVPPAAAKIQYLRKPARKGPCTGLVIDALGQEFYAPPLIRIFSEDNLDDPLYSVLAIRQKEKGSPDMYGHCYSLEEAAHIVRVTSNPIVLPVKEVRKNSDIILSQEDAYALTVANFNNFLSRARVVIVYEGGADDGQ